MVGLPNRIFIIAKIQRISCSEANSESSMPGGKLLYESNEKVMLSKLRQGERREAGILTDF